jgi:Zn-dependent protease with chaperone function
MFRSHRYRYDNEQVVLGITLLLVFAVIIVTSTATFCMSGLFIIGMFVLSALMIRSHHQSLMRQTLAVNHANTPELSRVVEECAQKLQPGEVDVFLAGKKEMNAYTFGLGNPKALVLYTPLLKVMSPGELKFIVGHEMGHVALGHTWLNTIIGGMAGIPAPFGAAVLLYAAFRWWNRMCEYSADRAGLLACGNLNQAVSAMVKLVSPNIRTQQEFEHALAAIDAEDDEVSNRLAQVFQTHPMLIRRIDSLRRYVKTAEYQRMQAGVNQNIHRTTRQPRQSEAHPQSPVIARVEERVEKQVDQQPPEERWPWLKRRD